MAWVLGDMVVETAPTRVEDASVDNGEGAIANSRSIELAATNDDDTGNIETIRTSYPSASAKILTEQDRTDKEASINSEILPGAAFLTNGKGKQAEGIPCMTSNAHQSPSDASEPSDTTITKLEDELNAVNPRNSEVNEASSFKFEAQRPGLDCC
jgi:hypothetical protein